MPTKYNLESFIEKANEIHKNKYEYNNIVWKNVGIKIKIGCKIHGIFEQSPSNHLIGKGCPYCSGVGRMTKNIFIKKAIKIHKDKYKYDNIADGFLITKNNV